MTDTTATGSFLHVGRICRDAPGLDALIAPDAAIERLADGFTWTEGPVWIADGGYWLFSDVPENKMYRWSEGSGVSLFLSPSGYDGPDLSSFREPGSNGLIRGPGDTILVADHGNRAVARLDLATKTKTLLATRYQGKRFNSPNDLVLSENRSIYFTDPPYGLDGLDASPHKELPHNGIYRLDPDGTVTLLASDLSFPNGIILSPDERTLYVANSDPKRAIVMAYGLGADRTIREGRVLVDMTAEAASGLPGLPDGMAIDATGDLFATGPGGIHIRSPDGTRLGRIETGTVTANCAFGEDGRTLFIASHKMVARVRTRTKGLGY